MKIKLLVKYLLYISLLIANIVLWEYIGRLSDTYFKHNFSPNYGYMALALLIGVSTGFILGLEHLINEIKKEGCWKINLPKLIIAGLPSLYISLTLIMIWSNNPFLQNIIAHPLIYLLRYGSGSVAIFQVILGFIIITSLYKKVRQ